MILTNVVFVSGDEDGEMSSDADELEVASDDDDFEEVDGFEGMDDDDFDFAPTQKSKAEQVKYFGKFIFSAPKLFFCNFIYLFIYLLGASKRKNIVQIVLFECMDHEIM